MLSKRFLRNSLGMFVAAIFLMVTWQISALAMTSQLLPTPGESIKAFFRLIRTDLHIHFAVSAYRVFSSIVLSLALALPLGLALGREKSLDRLLAPLIYLTYPIPKIVFLPIILVIFGIGDLSKIFLITLIVFFQIAVTARDAARSVPPQDIFSMLSLGANRWQIYRHVILPACLPEVLTSLRISMGTAIAVLFFVESFATTEGLGYFIMDAWSRAASADMFAGIIAMGLLGLAAFLLVDLLEFFLCRWRRLHVG